MVQLFLNTQDIQIYNCKKKSLKDRHVPCSPLTPVVNVCICRMDQVIKLRPGSTSNLAFLMGSSQLRSKSQLVACPNWLGLAELTFLLTRVMLSLPVCWNRHRHGLGHHEDIPVLWSKSVYFRFARTNELKHLDSLQLAVYQCFWQEEGFSFALAFSRNMTTSWLLEWRGKERGAVQGSGTGRSRGLGRRGLGQSR